MPEIGTSGSMSGDGKRGVGQNGLVTAPILDSTKADIPKRPLFCRYPDKRWGNRPASLWIAEDFGCCASG